MKNIFYTLLFAVFNWIAVSGQQLPHTSQFNEARSLWNPATTANNGEMKTSLFLREQWISFRNSPITGFVSLEYPFIDNSMSGGIGLTFDKSGPISKTGFTLCYAYKIKGIFTEESQLSVGLRAGLFQYRFDPSEAVVKDRDDPLAVIGRSSSIFPSANIGMFYISNSKPYNNNNVFFFGMSYSQVYAGNVLVANSYQERTKHLFLEVGKRFQGYDSYFEPSIMLNYSNPDIVALIISTKYEMKNVFWAGIGYSSVKDISIQGGVIVPHFGFKYAQLRLGVLANYGINDNASTFGAGYEFLLSYEYELD